MGSRPVIVEDVPTLFNIIGQAGTVDSADAEWLHQLIGDWQLVSDLAFADLFLVLRTTEDSLVVGAHCRPATAATVQIEDVVGKPALSTLNEPIREVFAGGSAKDCITSGMSVKVVPVRHIGEEVIAVLLVAVAASPDLIPNQVYINYEPVTMLLLDMISEGDFPAESAPSSLRHGTPRVTDGYIHLDFDGEVLYASPNAVSAFHRLGVKEGVVGKVLVEVVTTIIEDQTMVDETLPIVVMGRGTWVTEIENRGVVVSLRAVPLSIKGARAGAILLCRDISEIRRSERQLLTKDAMIREINHRVKNNLQTVSALLRLQARRAGVKEAQVALEDAQRRIYTISMVHEVLARTGSDTVDFDDTLDRLLRLAAGAASTGHRVTTSFDGSFGKIHADEATSLAVVLNELVTNAVEHGLAGRDGHISVSVVRNGDELELSVCDDGVGFDQANHGTGLGTRIVQTMVESDLLGTITWNPRSGGGTVVNVTARMRNRKSEEWG